MENEPVPTGAGYEVPPGEFVHDYLEGAGMPVSEFCEKAGISEEDYGLLKEGGMPLERGLAERISAALGTSVEFWTNLESDFRNCIKRQADNEKKGKRNDN